MSHPEQIEFFRACFDINANALQGARILEIGSYDVNGSVRDVFRGAEQYVGVDLVPGPGVDVIGFGHELQLGDGYFDVVISGECFEHDVHWRDTFRSMVRHTRPGGLVLVTCASRGRVEHGTARSGATQSPGTENLGSNYYKNITRDEFDQLPELRQFARHRSWYLSQSADLYFAGIKDGAASFQLPDADRVQAITKLMPLRERIIRIPLRAASRIPLPERHFQRFAIPYWQTTLRLRNIAGRVGALLTAGSDR